MNHDALHRKLAQLEAEISQAHSQSLLGTAMLPGIALTLDDALRVAANIRNRLDGTTRPRQTYHVSKSARTQVQQ